MRTIRLTVLAGCLMTATLTAANSPPVDLMPGVSEVQWGEATTVPGPAAIVLSEKAGPPEHVAAEMLARYVERRFGQSWAIHAANDVPTSTKLRVYLGQRRTFAALDQLCNEQNLKVPEQQDGYALKVWSGAGTVTAVVAGTNARGVIYGQDTLFQLLRKQADQVMIQAATIRDWPTIPLRGRVHPHYQYFLKPENFDCVMTSRMNYIDVRDGVYAFEPDAKLNKPEMSKIIKAARDRDLRVYAVVNCGVPAEQHEAVIKLFKELIDLGANGLWASFDDKGAGGAPREMVTRLLKLGRENGITGDAIAVTPPKGAYQVVKDKFNRQIVTVPGMEQAVWYWTSIPCAEDSADGAAIGLRVQPSWWHNWPRFNNPSLHSGGDRGYSPVLNMADGWNHPSDKELKEAGRYVHAVLPWDGWQAQQFYLVPVIGWWSWRPEQYDSRAINRRIYDLVFGPGQVETAAAFDDGITAISNRFQFWSTHTDSAPECPPRLKSLDERSEIKTRLEELGQKVASLQKEAASGSVLDPQVLQREYLGTMAREIETGLLAAEAPYPEYWFPAHQDAVLRAIYADELPKADQLIANVRERILKEVSEVGRMLEKSSTTAKYVEWWQARAKASAADWNKLIAKRQAELKERVADYGKSIAPIAGLMKNSDDPPVQIGTGAWERHNHVLATVLPEPQETFWGDWIGGIYKNGAHEVAVFALDRRLRVNSATYSELPVNIPISGARDRLALVIYLANANKESFGLGYSKWRWSGYRSLRLLWKEQELWKADIGIPRIAGEWFVIPLPPLPADMKTLPLRLRLEDYRPAKNNLEIVYLGPIRLLELDRP